MTKKNAIQEICDTAIIEEEAKYRGYRIKRNAPGHEDIGTIENPFIVTQCYYYIVHIEDMPISIKDFHNFDPYIKCTKGMYTIQYVPLRSYRRNKKFPYLIGQDLVRLRVLVSGPKHWSALSHRIPELGWLRRNSTLTNEMFRIAKMHPGLALRFGINFEKYCTTIEKKAEERGIDIDHKPLVCYAWNTDFIKENKDKKIAKIRSKADYIDVINEVNNSFHEEE